MLQRRSPSQVEGYQTFVAELSELPNSLEVAMSMETRRRRRLGIVRVCRWSQRRVAAWSTSFRAFRPSSATSTHEFDRLSFASGPASLVLMARDKGIRTGSWTTGELIDRLEASKRWSSGVGEEEEEKKLTQQQKLARIRRDMARESEKNDRRKTSTPSAA